MATFMKNSSFTVPDRLGSHNGSAYAPVSSTLQVSLGGAIKSIKVILDVTHNLAEDLDFMLVGPNGQSFVFWADVSGSLSNTRFTVADGGAAPTSTITSGGTYRATNNPDSSESAAQFGGRVVDHQAGPTGAATFAGVYGGAAASGQWTLYAVDDLNGSSGTVNDWGLEITTGTPELDFNGNGTSDLLWRNVNSGVLTTWQMNGSSAQQNTYVTQVATDWQVQGTGDFNGDGRADLLWRNANGQVTTWQMSSGAAQQNVFSGYVGTEWRIDAIGDFNADGRDDLLWRNTNGTYTTWQMDDSSAVQNVQIVNTPPEWKIVGSGDFNADGRDDLLWRHSTSGALATWQMNGATWQQDVIFTHVGTDWHVSGVGDFNGDGRDDIVWRNNNGQVTTWQLDGPSVQQNVFSGHNGTDWGIIDVADYNGDGRDDLLWRNVNSGQIAAWDLKVSGPPQSFFSANVGLDWRAQPDPYDFV